MNDPCKLLNEFLDAELAPGDQAVFEAHLPGCANCSSEVEMANELTNHVQSAWQSVHAPAQIAKKIQSKLANQSTPLSVSSPAFLPFRRIGWLTIAAALGVLLFGAIWWNSRPELAETETVLAPAASTDQHAPVVTVSSTGAGRDTILVRTPASNQRFTIFKAYPVVALDSANANLKGQLDVKTD